jgi:hypothetical protein
MNCCCADTAHICKEVLHIEVINFHPLHHILDISLACPVIDKFQKYCWWVWCPLKDWSTKYLQRESLTCYHQTAKSILQPTAFISSYDLLTLMASACSLLRWYHTPWWDSVYFQWWRWEPAGAYSLTQAPNIGQYSPHAPYSDFDRGERWEKHAEKSALDVTDL